MDRCGTRDGGSGLVLSLAVLAMLAVLATTFVSLSRLDMRVTRNYVDDQSCEMLARGTLNYFKALLRDDLDRTWGKYENRDAQVGMLGRYWNGLTLNRIPGLNTFRYGTPLCNDFWFNAPFKGAYWEGEFGGIYDDDSRGNLNIVYMQQSFASTSGSSKGVVVRFRDAANNRDFDAYTCLTLADYDRSYTRLVYKDHPEASGRGVDYDGDGSPWDDPTSCMTGFYFDTAPFVLFGGESYFQSGESLTGESALREGLFWRWGVKLGIAQSGYLNLNVLGNLEGTNTTYLANMGGVGLGARRAVDEGQSDWAATDSAHLGRIAWKGFTGEQTYAQGFPPFFNEVFWHPSQVGLERVFWRDQFDGTRPSDLKLSLRIPRRKARALVKHRWGADGRPGDGSDRWAVGWRRDAATYYRFGSPENPQNDSRYFGANEVMEHDHSAFNPRSSSIIDVLIQEGIASGLAPEAAALQARKDWRDIKPYVTMWSTDTILRGIIWPTEGPPFTNTPGDWRHIDILKRVNLNLIGAKGPEGLAGEDVALKTTWASKRDRERRRLYYMLLAGLRFSNTGVDDVERRHLACQFIASLADMVDRDQAETVYMAPDGSGVWALGVEKHPVINEVVIYLRRANSPDYTPDSVRVELYNPAENIPWIPDVDETYDVAEYFLHVGSHDYRVGDLHRYGSVYTDDRGRVDASDANRRIGADGLFADPADATGRTWSRLMSLGWSDGGSTWPPGLSNAEIEAPLDVSLWKPIDVTGLSAGEMAAVEAAPGVARINGLLCTRVDRMPIVRLLPDYRNDASLPGPGGSNSAYTGIYRRWDPMNRTVYGTLGTDEKSNVIWCKGWGAAVAATLGKPNVDYPRDMTTRIQSAWNGTDRSPYKYCRYFERNWKVVDGDLPSVGWLGELIMRNPAQDGIITAVNNVAQDPTVTYSQWVVASKLDTHAKFDLFRPFRPVQKYNPTSAECRTENLHMLDIFTVWDPSNDGFDNDGDGAIDDEDTGNQAGDRGGPEVRVFGRVDLNQAPQLVAFTPMPDNKYMSSGDSGPQRFAFDLKYSRGSSRVSEGWMWGPFETIGDLIRADAIQYAPATYFSRGTAYEGGSGGGVVLNEKGFGTGSYSNPMAGDDDGDGTCDERDERDMVFTWIANHFTTRSNVFDVDLIVETCEPPYYPNRNGTPRKLPFRTYKTGEVYARKHVLGILDRSTCLRIAPNGRCEFTGPVDVRMLRFTDEKRVW